MSEVLIKILEDEKVTKANGVPTIFDDTMKKNPPVRNQHLRLEYIVDSCTPEGLKSAF
jgi:hypothetical protein